MTYLKTLIALTGLALLTACAGGVTINNPVLNTGEMSDNDKKPDGPCVTNPYGTDCANPTERQRAVFCRDTTKITPTKTEDCTDIEDTVTLICSTNILDSLCPTASLTQAEAFCRDETKMTDTKTADCAPTMMRVCGANIFDTFCTATLEQEADFCRIGTNANSFNRCKATIIEVCNTNVFDTLCTTPTKEQAEAFCGDASKTTTTKPADCADTVKTACMADPFDSLCDGIMEYVDQRDALLLQCIAAGRGETVCNMEALGRACTGNPFTPECVADYAPRRREVCAGEINSDRCIPTVALVCGANAFDTYCIGSTAYRTEQLNQCAAVTQTAATCGMFFMGPLVGCLADPFAVGCDDDRSPIFLTNRDSIQTKRFTYCQTANSEDRSCIGYRICNGFSGFTDNYCGVPFNPKRMEFCAIPDNAFDVRCDNGLESASAQMMHCAVTAQSFNPGCVGNLRDAAKQLEFCQASPNPFGGGCEVAEFRAAREAFCMQTPTDIGCRTDALKENLMSEEDPCEGVGNTPACSVEVTDLPDTFLATPATIVVQVPSPSDPSGMMDLTVFDRGFLKTTTASFDAQGAVVAPTGTRLGSETFTIFGRRNLSDAATDANLDGYAYFRLFKDGLTDNASDHVTILPTTNLGAPLLPQPVAEGADNITAIWDGHFSYRISYVNIPQKFHIDFSAGKFTFADITSPDNIVGGGAIRDVPTGSFPVTLTLNGLFGAGDASLAAGQLGGDVTESSFSDRILPLMGLIGAEGAVGVYLGEFSIGGFTASNPDHANYQRQTLRLDGRTNQATYDDWRDVTTPADAPNTTTRANQFLTTTTHNLNNGEDGTSAELAGLLSLNDAKYNNVALRGHNDNQINYYRFPVSTDDYFYAGISEFTNVGVPLGAQPTGTWNGSFVAIDDDTTTAAPVDFNLTVTYGGAGTGYEGSVSSGTLGATGYTFTGKFDSRGVIVGTTAHATNGAGVLQGLIGADAALGVFISNANASVGYGGGFVACPLHADGKCLSANR